MVISSQKGSHYLIHGMKKHVLDILKEFESYILTDIDGMMICCHSHLLKCSAYRPGHEP